MIVKQNCVFEKNVMNHIYLYEQLCFKTFQSAFSITLNAKTSEERLEKSLIKFSISCHTHMISPANHSISCIEKFSSSYVSNIFLFNSSASVEAIKQKKLKLLYFLMKNKEKKTFQTSFRNIIDNR